MWKERRTENLTRQAFAPGNFVWGSMLTEAKWLSIVNGGIKRQRESGVRSYGYTPHCICLSLLDDSKEGGNYYCATHEGPLGEKTSWTSSLQMAILIDRKSLAKAFPGLLVAVGDYFQEERIAKYGDGYDFNAKRNTVYGLPIREVEGGHGAWNDEVRFYEERGPEKKNRKNTCGR